MKAGKVEVSVIVPTYNRKHTLARCIESVMSQSFQDWELLIVDDGSTDDTIQLVSKYQSKDDRVKYLIRDSSKPKGASACRNMGIENAIGKYIAFLDSDDEWLPNKLSSDLDVIKHDLNIKGVYSGIIIADSFGHYKCEGKPMKQKESCVDFLFSRGNIVATPTYFVIREYAKYIKFPEDLKCHEDWDFFIRYGEHYGWTLNPVCNVIVHWEGSGLRGTSFPSMIKYYEKYAAQISSVEGHASYLLRQWVSASKTDAEYKKYYIRKLRKLFFNVGLKYKVFSIAPELCFLIWQKTLESKSKFSVYEEVR